MHFKSVVTFCFYDTILPPFCMIITTPKAGELARFMRFEALTRGRFLGVSRSISGFAKDITGPSSKLFFAQCSSADNYRSPMLVFSSRC